MKVTMSVLAMAFAVAVAPAAHAHHACGKIEKMCKKAGHPKHGDCLDKIVAGGTVDGVTPDAADIAACKARKSK